jgi:DNA-binding NarL/FixJ family response regulator
LFCFQNNLDKNYNLKSSSICYCELLGTAREVSGITGGTALNTIISFGLDRLLHEILTAALSSHQFRIIGLEQALEEPQAEIVLAPGSGAPDDVVTGIRYVRERLPNCKMILLGVEGNDADIVRFIQEGARGFVSSQQGLADLVESLNMARENRGSCSGPVTQLMIDAIHRLSHGNSKPGTRLTFRETQILQMIQNGLSNKEIAERLCITANTVKNHVHHVLEKLRLRSRHEVARVQAQDLPLPAKALEASPEAKVQGVLLRA